MTKSTMSVGDDNDTNNGGNYQPTTGDDDEWAINFFKLQAKNSSVRSDALLRTSEALHQQTQADLTLNQVVSQFLAQRGSGSTIGALSLNHPLSLPLPGDSPNGVNDNDAMQRRVSIDNNQNQTRSSSSNDDGMQPPPPPSLQRFQDNPPKGFGVAGPPASPKAAKSSPGEGGEDVSIICLCHHFMLFFTFTDINSLHHTFY